MVPMVTSAETNCREQQPRAAQDRHQRFIDSKRLVLLSSLDGKLPANADRPSVLDFIERVLTEWEEQFRHDVIAGPDPRERTFWYALYQLEELVEAPGSDIDPDEPFLMKNLVEVRKLLRNQQPLPLQRFMATRPDGR